MNIKEVCNWIAKRHPQGEIVDGGYLYLGKTIVDGFELDVEGRIETCGAGLRVILLQGDELVYTTRLQQIGTQWYVADRAAVVECVKQDANGSLRGFPVSLGDRAFKNASECLYFLGAALCRIGMNQQVVSAEAVYA